MANWENHKYQDDYQDSLISKFFVFQFVNSNIALFYIAFYQQDFNKLGLNLGVILIAKQLSISGLQFLMPKIRVGLKLWWLNRKYKDPANAELLAVTAQDKQLQYEIESQLCLEDD